MMTTDTATIDQAAGHAAAMLAALGLGGDDRTAHRLVRALDELAHARTLDPATHLRVQFDPVSQDPGLVCVTDVPFTSICEHHMLPFSGIVTAAYLPHPGRPIVGLSKMARAIQGYAARPQLQERLTEQVATGLHTALDARGAACAVRAVHMCMALRGARTGQAAAMVTVQHVGEVGQPPWRAEFAARLTTDPWTR